MFSRTWTRLTLLAAVLAAVGHRGTHAQGADCVDREPQRTGWGWFARTVSCVQVVETGQCEGYTADGYCLVSCDACPKPVTAEAPETETAAAATAATAATDNLDPEAAAAAAYREELLEQVAIMEDGTGEVEVLPSLVYDRELPDTPATAAAGIPKGEVQAEIGGAEDEEDGVLFAAVEGDVEPSCDEGSALGALTRANLTTLVELAGNLNIGSVLNDTSVPFTLFAPTNEAFEKAFPDLEKQLEDVDGTINIVFTHIVADKLLKTLVDGSINPLSGAVLFVRDGAIISRAATGHVLETYSGCNWVIHVIDDVLGEDNAENPDFRAILQG